MPNSWVFLEFWVSPWVFEGFCFSYGIYLYFLLALCLFSCPFWNVLLSFPPKNTELETFHGKPKFTLISSYVMPKKMSLFLEFRIFLPWGFSFTPLSFFVDGPKTSLELARRLLRIFSQNLTSSEQTWTQLQQQHNNQSEPEGENGENGEEEVAPPSPPPPPPPPPQVWSLIRLYSV